MLVTLIPFFRGRPENRLAQLPQDALFTGGADLGHGGK